MPSKAEEGPAKAQRKWFHDTRLFHSTAKGEKLGMSAHNPAAKPGLVTAKQRASTKLRLARRDCTWPSPAPRCPKSLGYANIRAKASAPRTVANALSFRLPAPSTPRTAPGTGGGCSGCMLRYAILIKRAATPAVFSQNPHSCFSPLSHPRCVSGVCLRQPPTTQTQTTV